MLPQDTIDAIQQRLLAVAELAGIKGFEDDLALLFIDLKEARRLANEAKNHYCPGEGPMDGPMIKMFRD